MKKMCLYLILVIIPLMANASERVVKCQVDGNGSELFKGDCLFKSDKDGSFHIRSIDTAKPILKGVSDISVYVVEKGLAEVRGLTLDGINSRWGPAYRSETDRACWVGSDFKVCAW